MRKLHFFSILVALSLATSSLWATPSVAVNGKLPGVFTIDGGNKVCFSQGNLQAVFEAANTSVCMWQFADEQYHYVGEVANNKIGNNCVTAVGKVDLFGWVAEGSTLAAYGINNIKGGSYYLVASGVSHLKSDWGTTMGDGWFTLTQNGWNFLLETRAASAASTIGESTNIRYAKATVNNVCGVILFPNGGSFTSANFTLFTASSLNAKTVGYGTITCTLNQWRVLEEAGCVFLPAAGTREGTDVMRLGTGGRYWSSYATGGNATRIDFTATDMNYHGTNWTPPYYGHSVRLVQYAPAAAVVTEPEANTLYATGSAQALVTAGEATGGTMQYKLGSGSWSTSIPTGTDAGNYSIYYKAIGDATHNNSVEVGPINVTILPPPASIGTLPTAKSPLIYTGGELELVNAGSGVSGGTLKYSLDGNTWRTEIPTASALGDYNVYWKLEGDASHSDYIPEPAYIAVSITIPTVSDNADPSTVLSNLYNNGTSTQLKIERTIYRNGEYNTICLPFALDATQLAASPLNGFNNLKTIKGASISGTAPDLSIDIFVEDVTEMEAGKPYLISYPSANENIVNPVFTGITVTTTEPGFVSADGVTFQGMFAQVHINPYTNERDEDYLFLGANSQLMWPNNDGSSMRGFRAYFIIDRNAIPAQVAPRGTHARFVNAPKQPTAIENTELNTQAQKLLENGQLIILKNGIKYNAQGQVLK